MRACCATRVVYQKTLHWLYRLVNVTKNLEGGTLLNYFPTKVLFSTQLPGNYKRRGQESLSLTDISIKTWLVSKLSKHISAHTREHIRTAACILYLRSGDDKCWPSGRVNVDMMKKILQRLAGCVRLVSIILRGGGGCATPRPLIIKPLHLREHRKWKAGLIGTACTGGENLKNPNQLILTLYSRCSSVISYWAAVRGTSAAKDSRQLLDQSF